MYIKHTLSTFLALACLLAACGPQAATPGDPQQVSPPTVTAEDQQQVVRVILGLSPDESGDVCELYVECDAQGNVTEIYLTDNSLTSLPPEIWQLTRLKALVLSNNQLTRLPPELGQLTNLQVLYLSYNPLTHLPPEIGQLTNLQELYIINYRLNPLVSLWLELCITLNQRCFGD